MSSNNVIGQEVSHANQSDAAEFPVVEETPELHGTVELEIQGEVDTNHPDAGVTGLTLEAEAVAYVVGRHFGLEMDNSAFYLAAWQGEDTTVLQERLGRISRTASDLIDSVDADPPAPGVL